MSENSSFKQQHRSTQTRLEGMRDNELRTPEVISRPVVGRVPGANIKEFLVTILGEAKRGILVGTGLSLNLSTSTC